VWNENEGWGDPCVWEIFKNLSGQINLINMHTASFGLAVCIWANIKGNTNQIQIFQEFSDFFLNDYKKTQ
jgi:hypothetical protein